MSVRQQPRHINLNQLMSHFSRTDESWLLRLKEKFFKYFEEWLTRVKVR